MYGINRVISRHISPTAKLNALKQRLYEKGRTVSEHGVFATGNFLKPIYNTRLYYEGGKTDE
jgi:hypothetical protein